MQLEKAAQTMFEQKICTFNVDEIDTCALLVKCRAPKKEKLLMSFAQKSRKKMLMKSTLVVNFINIFSSSFCDNIFLPKNYKAKL